MFNRIRRAREQPWNNAHKAGLYGDCGGLKEVLGIFSGLLALSSKEPRSMKGKVFIISRFFFRTSLIEGIDFTAYGKVTCCLAPSPLSRNCVTSLQLLVERWIIGMTPHEGKATPRYHIMRRSRFVQVVHSPDLSHLMLRPLALQCVMCVVRAAEVPNLQPHSSCLSLRVFLPLIHATFLL